MTDVHIDCVEELKRKGWRSPEDWQKAKQKLKLKFNDEGSPEHCEDCRRIMTVIDEVFGNRC